MAQKYFLHRIQKEAGAYTKGIEVHDTLDSAILSFYGRMKLGYNNPQKPDLTLMSCKITDSNGSIISKYNRTWQKEKDPANPIFLHHIRKDGDTYTKDIDICENMDAAQISFAANMEYGYSNPRFPDVEMVSCMITNQDGFIVTDETWVKAEEEVEPEVEPSEE